MIASLPDNETERLNALREAAILDTAPEAAFDDLARLAAHICGTPIAAVTLIDTDRQWFKSILGLPVTETPRETSFCAHTILQTEVLHIADTSEDARFADNPLVTGDPPVRFYAGAPIVTPEGFALGSLCVIDLVPRQLTVTQRAALQSLARQTAAQIELTRRIAFQECLMHERRAAEETVRQSERRLAEAQQVARIGSWEYDIAAKRSTWSAEMFRLLGFDASLHAPDKDTLLTHFHFDDVEMYTEVTRQALVDGLPFEFDIRILPGDGTMRWCHVVGQGEHDSDGQMSRLFGVVMDITERKQVEDENARLAAIVESSNDAVMGTTMEGMIVSWNASAARLYGYAESEIIGRHVSLLAPPDQRRFWAIVTEGLQSGAAQENHLVQRRRKDESCVNISLTFSPIRNRRGEMVGVAAIGRDVTAQCVAEEAVRRSEARLVEAQQIAQIGSYEQDIATGKLTFSQEMYRLYEFDPALGEPSVDEVRSRYTPEDLPRRDAVVQQAQESGQSFERDMCLVLPSGKTRWCHAVSRIVCDSTGKAIQMVGTVMDITERMLSEQRFRILFEESSDAHLLFDDSGIIDCNQAAVTMMGCANKAQMLALDLAAISPEYQPDGKRSDEKFAEIDARLHTQGYQRFEWIHRKIDGELFPVEVALTLVKLQDKPIKLVVWHDLTERKRAEQQIKDYSVLLELQKSELEKANKELAALATTDGLTGLQNHRAFQEKLLNALEHAQRYQEPLSVVLLDVDNFKQFNDTYGHPAGDDVLRQVARLLEQTIRDCDVAARYGGEEFVLILPQTDLNGAMRATERCRTAIETALWRHRPVTASFGVATLSLETADGTAMIVAADRALYAAKANGRNQVRHICLVPVLAKSA